MKQNAEELSTNEPTTTVAASTTKDGIWSTISRPICQSCLMSEKYVMLNLCKKEI